MTVGELIDELKKHERTKEVYWKDVTRIISVTESIDNDIILNIDLESYPEMEVRSSAGIHRTDF